MNKTAVFSRNLIYALGGAERSLYEELKNNYFDKKLELVYLEQPQFSKLEIDYSDFKQCFHNSFSSPLSFSGFRFAYYEYCLNIGIIRNVFSQLECDHLIAQNRWAPAAILAAKSRNIETTYYLRDESSYGCIANYYNGWKKLIKNTYKLAELPAIRKYIQDNDKAILASDRVIANSNFVAEKIHSRLSVYAEVKYPHIDKEKLLQGFCQHKENFTSSPEKKGKNIVLIGDTLIKGINTFKELAKLNPQHTFVCYGKSQTSVKVFENLIFKPWSKTPVGPYCEADVLLVPSIWDEAFGRVSIEAQILGIPVIVSNKGGLPETVNYDSRFIAKDTQDFNKKLRELIN